MTSAVDLIRPGIVAMFRQKGYEAIVRQDIQSFAVVVSVSKGEYVEKRTFPLPADNAEISVPLRAWRDELA